MTKQEQIAAKAQKPFEPNDRVVVKIPYTEYKTTTKTIKGVKTKVEVPEEKLFVVQGFVVRLEQGRVVVKSNSWNLGSPVLREMVLRVDNREDLCSVPVEYVSYTFQECGANPFREKPSKIVYRNVNVHYLLTEAGYGSTVMGGKPNLSFKENLSYNFDPFIIDANGEKQYYQRELVWTVEQKQDLIESIYNWTDIGKILVRVNSHERMEKIANETGNWYIADVVDGKQRLSAIIDFVLGKFSDKNGNYWEDLSEDAQNSFLWFDFISYGELPTDTKDREVVATFVRMNSTGVPISKEHLDKIQKISV